MNQNAQRKSEICSFAHTSLICQAVLLLLMASVFFNTNYQFAQPSLLETSSTKHENPDKLREIRLLQRELEEQRHDSEKLLLSQKEEKIIWKQQMMDFKDEQASLHEEQMEAFKNQQTSLQDSFQEKLREQKMIHDQEIEEFKKAQDGLEVALRFARQDIKALQSSVERYSAQAEDSAIKMEEKPRQNITPSTIRTEEKPEQRIAHKSKKETRVIVTISIRPRKGTKHAGQYCTKRFTKMAEYAKTVDADFFVINSTDHESMILNNPDLDVHFYKFIVIQYYLERYDALLWFDDTIIINANCSCTPNIFELSEDTVAARDVTRPEMSVLCTRIRNSTVYWSRYNDSKMFAPDAKPCHKLKHQSNFEMFNAGLMTFRKKHLKIFYDFRETWEIRAEFSKKSTDQAVFNFLLYYHGFQWVNINKPKTVIEQGSKLVAIILEDRKLPCIGHITKGSRHWRHVLLCDDWEFCLREDYFTTNETIVSPLKFINKNSILGKKHRDVALTEGVISWDDPWKGLDCSSEGAALGIDKTTVTSVDACQYMCQAHAECNCIVYLDGGCSRRLTCNPDKCLKRKGAITVTGIRSFEEEAEAESQ